MPEQKHKIGKTSINSQLSANVNSQNYAVVIKQIIITCKTQWKEPRNLLRTVTVYSLFEENNTE